MKKLYFIDVIHFIKKCIHYSINLCFPKDPQKILFQSGPDDYVDNARALSDYILNDEKYKDFKIYWALKDHRVQITNKRVHTFIRNGGIGRIKYLFHTVTAKYLFSTHGAFDWYCHYKQKYICLWHGTMLKKISHMQDPVGNKYSMTHCKNFISPSQFYNNLFAESFACKLDGIITTGYPRVDLLFQDTDSLDKLGIRLITSQKIVAYMPTFRQAIGTSKGETSMNVFKDGFIDFTNKDSLYKWNNFLFDLNILLVIKPHPSDNNIPSHIMLSNIKVITNEDLAKEDVQLYHFLRYTDALITDFSSVFCDYLVLDRPIGFIVTDIEEYTKRRGFVYDNPIDYMPGKIIDTEDSFREFFNEISKNIDSEIKKRHKLSNIYNDFNDGNNCLRVLEAAGIA